MAYLDKADQAASAKRHYERNAVMMKVRAVAYKKEHRVRLRQIVVVAKQIPCIDCGVQYPTPVMEFDHVRGVKVRDIATMVNRSVGAATLRLEIAKCEVVCANCHRLRTFTRREYDGLS